jgi:hypothetical protein
MANGSGGGGAQGAHGTPERTVRVGRHDEYSPVQRLRWRALAGSRGTRSREAAATVAEHKTYSLHNALHA